MIGSFRNCPKRSATLPKSIIYSYRALVEIDLYFAKASLAYKMKATVPNILETGEIDLKKARHPLIDPQKVVPIDVNLGKDFNTLVITGPNTGGKTVTLKTLGLMTLMAMCGLMLPVAEGSTVSVYKKVLVDIGDEQSIEQEPVHLLGAHDQHRLDHRGVRTQTAWYCIDELGAGTDPAEGAALAIADHGRNAAGRRRERWRPPPTIPSSRPMLCRRRACANASCEFDVNTLAPHLPPADRSCPGKSNAFAISQRLGLPEEIIRGGQTQHLGRKKTRFEEASWPSWTRPARSWRRRRRRLTACSSEQIDSKRNLEQYKQKTYKLMDRELQNAQDKANRIVSSAKAESQKLLDELDELRRQKESEEFSKLVPGRRIAPTNLTSTAWRISLTRLSAEGQRKNMSRRGRSRRGIWCWSPSWERRACCSLTRTAPATCRCRRESSRQRSRSAACGWWMKKRRRQLSRMEKKENGGVTKTSVDKSQRSASSELDLRGQTIEEAIMMVDQFIDSCTLLGIKTITIIHGKGTGALRSAVQQHLKNHRAVRTFRLGVYGEGEDGVTIAELK